MSGAFSAPKGPKGGPICSRKNDAYFPQTLHPGLFAHEQTKIPFGKTPRRLNFIVLRQ